MFISRSPPIIIPYRNKRLKNVIKKNIFKNANIVIEIKSVLH